MRSESEMYDLILDIAKSDKRICAVYMNGSRTNVNVPKDIFQDYDIVYVVTDTKHFIEDKDWILLDKENILPPVAEATDIQYHVKKPTQQQFACTCNEFWWCLNNVAKGLWREEITYAQDMLNFHVRKQLEKMLSYKIGIDTDFSVSVGKSAKYMYRWLSANEWQMYLLTYSAGNTEACWEAVFIMCDLFEESAKYVAEKMVGN